MTTRVKTNPALVETFTFAAVPIIPVIDKVERRRAWDRARYARDREKRLAASNEYHSRPEVKARQKEWLTANPERAAAYATTKKLYIAEHKEEVAASRHKHWLEAAAPQRRQEHYGLSEDAYQVLLAVASGSCMLCHKPTNKLHIDHNHETGEVRGLLCGSCNRGLGMFHDNTETLTAAIEYLRRNV